MEQVSKETIFPVKNYLLIEVEEQTETSSGLLLSEDGGPVMPTVGKILKSGELAEYKKGEVVIFRKYSADEIKVTTAEKEEKYWLLEDSEVIALVNKKEKEDNKYEQIELKRGRVGTEKEMPRITKITH